MRHFRAGSFDRERMPHWYRKLSPSESLEGLEDIDLGALWESGKRIVLLDVDNTLLPWRSHDIPDSTMAWLEKGKALGFKFCILSNTRNPERLEKLTQQMGVDYVRDKYKPSPKMFHMALERHKFKVEEAVMIGDQLLTDVLGANRCGIDAIWVRPIHAKEFIGTTVVSRNIEKLIGKFLYRHFQADENEVAHQPEKPGLFEHNLVREFVKFVIVGGTSTVVDLGLHFWLMHYATWQGDSLVHNVGSWILGQKGVTNPTAEMIRQEAFGPLKVGPVVLAVLNSYFWNSRWTFRVGGQKGEAARIIKFFVIALVGMVINVQISSGVYRIAPGGDRTKWAIASIVAMAIVVFWNFFGQKFWTFRKGQKP